MFQISGMSIEMEDVQATPVPRRPADESVSVDSGRGRAAVWWALIGVVLLFAVSVARLGARGVATMRGGLEPGEWIGLAVLTALFVYGEGVRGIGRRWVPAVLRRIGELRGDVRGIDRVLAPFYAMMLIGAPRRTLWRAWLGVAAIVAAVLIVRALPEPWRGVTDFAVASALAWGMMVILVGARRVV